MTTNFVGRYIVLENIVINYIIVITYRQFYTTDILIRYSIIIRVQPFKGQ